MSANWISNLFGVNLAALELTAPEEVKNATAFLGLTPSKVSREHLPALRALISQTFPTLKNNPQARSRLESVASQVLGDKLGGYLNGKQSMSEYANGVNLLSQDQRLINNLKFIKKLSDTKNPPSQPQGPLESFGDQQPDQQYWRNQQGEVGGKITLAAHFIQAGAQELDTTIPKKVESAVSGDLFSFWAPNPENGVYNGMYLQDCQWEKEVHFKEELALPRSGDDQLYFQSFHLLPQFDNIQPVEVELMDMLEDKMYAIYQAHNQNLDPLHDKQLRVDPIMNREQYSRFIPEVILEADGKYPYPDPDDPQGPGFMNRVGFRPINDSFRDMQERSRYENVLIMPSIDAFRLAQLQGVANGVMTT